MERERERKLDGIHFQVPKDIIFKGCQGSMANQLAQKERERDNVRIRNTALNLCKRVYKHCPLYKAKEPWRIGQLTSTPTLTRTGTYGAYLYLSLYGLWLIA